MKNQKISTIIKDLTVRHYKGTKKNNKIYKNAG